MDEGIGFIDHESESQNDPEPVYEGTIECPGCFQSIDRHNAAMALGHCQSCGRKLTWGEKARLGIL